MQFKRIPQRVFLLDKNSYRQNSYFQFFVKVMVANSNLFLSVAICLQWLIHTEPVICNCFFQGIGKPTTSEATPEHNRTSCVRSPKEVIGQT